MSYQIAVAGDRASGRSAIAAAVVGLLRGRGLKPVLAVDADPATGLGAALGIPAGKRVIDVLEEVVRTEGEAKERLLERRLHQECIGEGVGCDLVTMGRPAGMEAHCYLNSVFRDVLAVLKENYRAVVVDCEPELEHLFAMNRDETHCLLVVGEPTRKGAHAAARIASRSREPAVAVRKRVLILSGSREGDAVGLAPEGVFDAILVLPAGSAPEPIIGRILES